MSIETDTELVMATIRKTATYKGGTKAQAIDLCERVIEWLVEECEALEDIESE